MSTYNDFFACKKEVRPAKFKRDASILALENTCARFNSITCENAKVRIFTQIDNVSWYIQHYSYGHMHQPE